MISHAFFSTPFYDYEQKCLSKPSNHCQVLHICLKTFGFPIIAGTKGAGKSVLYIWSSNIDPEVKSKISSSLQDSGSTEESRTHQTSQNELLFYNEYIEELFSVSVRGNRVYYNGAAAYGVINLSEVLCQRNIGGTSEFYAKFKAKLCYEKYFTNIIARRVLCFNEKFVLILPLRDSTDIYLYNILTDRYCILRFNIPHIQTNKVDVLKRRFICSLTN